ncbi:M48 family metallopeptidase [Orbus sturtevantii]|uniref:M48 family metallopeptidase n=1 Tax=Orbus sturtevantii TaxID=3074109 RepID=UPI00370DCFE4
MKLKLVTVTMLMGTLVGCQMDTNNMLNLGMQSAQIASLSDSDVKALSDKSCAQMDAEAKIAATNNAYTTRLNKITKALGNEINGTKVNYKVYLTNDVNAWAMANGCVRVYSGLMDKMTDNEIQGVLGHELGHVALGHSKKAMQVSYGTQLARGAIAASTNSTIANLTQSQLGDLTEGIINAQFSQKQESQADNYSFDFLVKKGINPLGIATAFEKLGGGEASLLSTHPASSDRAKNIRDKIAKLNQTK